MSTSRHSQVSPRTVWTVGLHALLVTLLGLLLWKLTDVFQWIGLVLLMALALDPLVRALERRGMGRGWAVLVVMLSLLVVMATLVATLLPMLVDQVRALARALPDLVHDLGQLRWVRWLDEHVGLVERMQTEMRARAYGVAGSAVGLVTSVVGRVAVSVAVLALTVFALLSGGDLYESALDWLDPEDRPRVEALAERTRLAVGGYVAGTFTVAAIGAAVTALTMLALGVPYFLPLGLSYLVLGIIPFVGSALAAVLITLSTLLTVGGKSALVALVVFLVYQQVEGNVLQPLVQRHTIRMNPLLIGLVIFVGAGVAGLFGTVMALPVAAAAQVFLRDVHARRCEQRMALLRAGHSGPGEAGALPRPPDEGPPGVGPLPPAHPGPH